MIDFGPVFFIVGMLLTFLSVAMCVPAAVDLATGHPDWQVFLGAGGITLFIGVSMMLATRTVRGAKLGLRQAFILTTMSWVSIAAFGSLPFAFSELDMSAADAFFESMSGVTTTGATVISNLDGAPPGILLWRALLQWLGGIGIIVMALAVLPMLSVGGMQLFVTEAFDTPDKVLPRAAQLAGGIGSLYLGLTFVCAVALWLAGMEGFDAVAHAMTTIATGGYSTKDASVGYFNTPAIDWIITVGMIVGSLPFVHYLRIARGDSRSILRDSQVRWFLSIVVICVSLVAVWILFQIGLGTHDALRYAAFNVVSVITGTGYATTDFGAWGGFVATMMLILMFVGGCAGSTTCGIKIFRFQVLYATARVQLARLLRPHGVFIPYYNRKPIPEAVSEAVMGFFFLYILCFGLVAMALAAMGLDIVTALSGSATAISNVGPGLGPIIGPAGNFDPLPDGAKWLLCFAMLLGRLELFTVLVLITPTFWRK
ncbi:TrkH family potassium uptake protein [Thalassobaculum sp. OXR-137]|uniref:TrkH family potassium uptake protein n=1 Tax=Thalassobaculum sp. OXR-137 TaxID=3100173 RepID=UPI002AC92180|nr:TrkH family potassium uptake protein [Thalassobaculum sp. OXR-137]WPZ36352.1 TrkH family potassium uptake protein [Thalassobaculum sp. OXR-137]